ncbi:MAG: hypothetical protein A3J79_10455 [Elusimicrobia bacterium RIFOXYB2_FULL_62_6]|nr:MAG: hypothetical protein A3J79_10455 [Elusimicrobia bacterium RIFOXYB2_FULL_62_6]
MKKTASLIVAAFFSASGLLSAAPDENKVLSEAGLSIQQIEVPRPAPAVPEAKYNQQNTALRKIKLNEANPGANNTLVAMLVRHTNLASALRELNSAGFKAKSLRGLIEVDVTGDDAADRAIGLAKYSFVGEVRVGKAVYDSIFTVRSKSTYAVKIGTIKGGMNHTPVELTFNKLEWTIKGAANYAPVDVKIDHEAKTVTGGVNHSPVSLKFDWSTEEITVDGAANYSPVKYTVNWKAGLLEGYANHSPLRLQFDMQEGTAEANTVTVTGYVNHAPVSLTYDKISGRLDGAMNLKPVGVTLVNCDLYDFLTYFFIFVK